MEEGELKSRIMTTGNRMALRRIAFFVRLYSPLCFPRDFLLVSSGVLLRCSFSVLFLFNLSCVRKTAMLN